MENALLVGLSRQMALTHELDVIANNIANIDTTGYKSDNAVFSEYLMPRASDQNFTGHDRRVDFVQDRATWIDMSPGAIQHTGNPLDVAIDGSSAFLVVQNAAADSNATRATARSRSMRPASSSPAKAIRSSAMPARSLSSPGRPRRRHQRQRHHHRARGQQHGRHAARQAATRHLRPAAASAKGRRLDLHGAQRRQSPIRPRPAPRVVQGAIEKSNVNGVAEMARLIEITRSYTDIANILQQQSDQRRNALSQLSQTPTTG